MQVFPHSLRLALERHVRGVADGVQGARRVRIESSELATEVVVRLASGGDEFETLAQRAVRGQARDQDLGDLATLDNSVAGIAGMAAIALEEYESMFVRFVVVEPALSALIETLRL